MRVLRVCCGGLTGSESPGYYEMLGLDSDASEQSIKVAYRQLARENHPDLLAGRGPSAVEEASRLMRQINEAYRVLSNKHLRKEYDKSLKEGATFTATMPAAAPVESPSAGAATARAPSKMRVGDEVGDSIVGGFSREFKKDIAGGTPSFKWSDLQLEGFDWGAVAGFWTTRYITAMRGFARADMPSAKKFANYCNLAIEGNTHALKSTYFLFFFGFQKAVDQQVPVFLRQFCANETGQRTAAPACIVLMDIVRRKSLLCGPRPDDERYGKLLQTLGMLRS
jgi:curved DNA-binding protein CbpA